MGLFLFISCSVNKQIVETEGSYYRLFSSPANGEKKLFISLNLPKESPASPDSVMVNGESVAFETISGKPILEVFISEFMQPENTEEQEQRELFLRLAAADEINVKVKYPSKFLIYENVPKQVSEQLEMMSAPQGN